MSHSTQKRTFRPNMSGGFSLEPRLVLDAASIPAEVAAAMEAKQELKDDLATYQFDYLNYKIDVLAHKIDRASLMDEIVDLRAEVRSFNDQYAPKKATLKLTSEIGLGGIGVPKLTFEVDLTGVKANLLEDAQARRDELTDEAGRLELETAAMNLRAKELNDRGAALQLRKTALDKAELDVNQKEQIVMMDEMGSGVALTDFSDADLANSEIEVNNIGAELSATLMGLAYEQQTPECFCDNYELMPGYGGY